MPQEMLLDVQPFAMAARKCECACAEYDGQPDGDLLLQLLCM